MFALEISEAVTSMKLDGVAWQRGCTLDRKIDIINRNKDLEKVTGKVGNENCTAFLHYTSVIYLARIR